MFRQALGGLVWFGLAVVWIALNVQPAASAADLYLAHPDAVDGITLADGSGKTYRLHGVTLPLQARQCVDDSATLIDCEAASRAHLERFSASVLSCSTLSKSGSIYRVRCTDFMGRDVARRMVQAGWAVPDRAISQAYIFEDIEARARQVGMWRTQAVSKR